METRVSVNFKTNAARFLEESIKAYVRESPDNSLNGIAGSPIFDEPLVGFADGDDPLFLKFKEKEVIGDFHLTPREALEKHVRQELDMNKSISRDVSVISWVIPLSSEVRVSNRVMTDGPSLKWNHARWQGRAFLEEKLTAYVLSLLRERGYLAVAPGIASFFKSINVPDGGSSVWSERHIAYAAGLGTFSLIRALITPKGVAVRCGSVVTDLKLPPSPRLYSSHTANCAFLEYGSCGLCAVRCPVGAVTARGHDKIRCNQFANRPLDASMQKQGFIGKLNGCGLCMTGVPCEAQIPGRVSKRFIH